MVILLLLLYRKNLMAALATPALGVPMAMRSNGCRRVSE